MSLQKDLEKFARKTNSTMHRVVRKSIISISNAIVLRTPVDTGRARGNWQAVIDSPSFQSINRVDPSGEMVKSEIMQKAQKAPGRLYYFINNLSYIPVLEFGLYPNPPKTGNKTINGFSTQADRGMVRISALEFKEFIKKAANESE